MSSSSCSTTKVRIVPHLFDQHELNSYCRADTDVDLQNRLDGATPLHLAVKLDNEAARQGVIEMLLGAGADPKLVIDITA